MRLLTLTVAALIACAGLAVPVGADAAPSATSAGLSQQAECRRTLKTYPRLIPGARRPAVRSLQCVLNDGGFGPVTVDGFYGPETKAAIGLLVGTFEGLPAHPYVVQHWYWTILFARSHQLRGLEIGDGGIRVRTLQRALRADGESVVVDGAFGPQTRSAVLALQVKCSLKQSGRVDDPTAFYLGMGGCSP